jgi:hypothetical protein
MRNWGEHVENHQHCTCNCLDDIALRHVAGIGGALSAETLLTLTAAETDYLYATIARLREAQREAPVGIEADPRAAHHPFRFPH